MSKLVREKVLPIILSALNEDMGARDITTEAIFEGDMISQAGIFVKENCMVCGIDVVRWVFNALDEKIAVIPLYKDGDLVKKGKKVISLKGSVKKILAGERTALNFLGRLSGIATLTNKFVEKVKGTPAKIFDTRKTTPGMRVLEKYAVRMGGGCNHRMGLWDGILIKDNHLIGVKSKVRGEESGAIQNAISACKVRGYENVEIEVNSLEEFKEALTSGADIVMLDNMKVEDIRKVVKLRDKTRESKLERVILEVSGGVTLDNVAKIAKTDVDRISIGSLTHSAPSIDFSLECQSLN